MIKKMKRNENGELYQKGQIKVIRIAKVRFNIIFVIIDASWINVNLNIFGGVAATAVICAAILAILS